MEERPKVDGVSCDDDGGGDYGDGDDRDDGDGDGDDYGDGDDCDDDDGDDCFVWTSGRK